MKKFFIISTAIMITFVVSTIIIALQDQFLQLKIDRLNKEIYNSYGELQQLKAEWNYLNNSEYLRELNKKYAPDLLPYNTSSINTNKIYSLPVRPIEVNE